MLYNQVNREKSVLRRKELVMFCRKKKEVAHMIVLRENAFNVIKEAKGWKTDAELARNLNFTRQYICSLKKRKTPVTHDVMVRIAIILGDTQGNWWHHFEMAKTSLYDPNSNWSIIESVGEKGANVERRE